MRTNLHNKVSYFRVVKYNPKTERRPEVIQGVPVSLHALLENCRSNPRAEHLDLQKRIIAETDPAKQSELKEQMPCFMPACVVNNRTENQVLTLSGFTQIDLDGVADYFDATRVRDMLFKLTFVAYASLSIRKTGVWLLVRIDTNNFKRAWQECNDYIRGLLLDSLAKQGIEPPKKMFRDSKGQNPTDLRFISIDPDAKIRINPTLFIPPKEKPKPKPKTFTYTKNATNQEAIANHIQREIDQAPDGQKHETLRRLSFWAGGLVAGGQISFDQAHDILKTSILSRKIDSERNAEKTIESGLRKGAEKPIYPSSQPSVAYSRYDWSQKGAIAAFESENDPIRSCTQPCEHTESYITIEGEQYSLLINANGYPSDWDNVEPLLGYQARKQAFEQQIAATAE